MAEEFYKSNCVVGAGPVGRFLAGVVQKKAPVSVLIKDSSSPLPAFECIRKADLGRLAPGTAFWLCVKAYDLDRTLADLKPFLGRSTAVIIISNGLGIYLQSAFTHGRAFPMLRLLLNFGVMADESGEITVAGPPAALLASIPEDRAAAQELKILLESAGFKISVEKDIATAEWKKALVNLTVNSLATLADSPNSVVAERPALKYIAEKILCEVRSVAKKDGFDLSESKDEKVFESIRAHGSNFNSNLLDLRRGRKSDMEFLMGRFLRIAKDHSVAVPWCEFVNEFYTYAEREVSGEGEIITSVP